MPVEQDFDWNRLRELVGASLVNVDEHMRAAPPDYAGLRNEIKQLLQFINPRLSCTIEAHDMPTLAFHRRLQTIRLRLLDNNLNFEISSDLSDSSIRHIIISRALGPLILLAFASENFASASGIVHCELGDEGYGAGMSFCSCVHESFLVPDSDFFVSGGYEDFRKALGNLSPWEARDRRVVWRGSSTGIPRRTFSIDDPDPFSWLPRAELCHRLSTGRYSAIADTYISNIVQITDGDAVAALHQANLVAGGIAKKDFARAKMIIDIDGNTNAWSGLFCSLLLGSCILKVASPFGFKQWYYDSMQPWVHYVPVSADLSDLEERIDWVLAFDHVAKAIGQQGADFAHALTFKAAMADAVSRLKAHLALSSY